MKRFLCYLFIFFPSMFLFAQNHDYYWPMGYASFTQDTFLGRTVIDFKTDPPLIFREDRELNFLSTMASFCNSEGNLLFYTNGIRMMNNEHELVENGDSLNTGPLALSDYFTGYASALDEVFLPLPGYSDSLFLFHISHDYDDIYGIAGVKLHKTTIATTANGGAGWVVSKNIPLLEDVTLEGLTAVKHANGRDWWIFTSAITKNQHYSFLLSSNGVELMDEFELTPPFPFLYASSFMVFSPDGRKMAHYYVTDGVYVYDFDRCSGFFENPVFVPLPNTSLGGGLSISPNSRFLYIMSNIQVFQIDLWADDIPSSIDTVAVYDGYQSPFSTRFLFSQLGPDGRVYINSLSSVDVLHAIQYPNKKGLACEVRQHSVQLPTYNAFTMPHFPNYRLGPLDGSPCDTLGLNNMPIAKYRYEQDTFNYLQVEFTDLSYYEPTEWHWDFGDNTTSQETDPVHVFPQSGTYEVCLTVSNMNGEDTFCRTLSLGTVSSSEEAEMVNINVFPNPCREGVNVIISDYLPRDAKVVLYDAVGQRHKVQSVQTGWNTVRLDGLRAGIYFYEIWEKDVRLDSGKLVKVE